MAKKKEQPKMRIAILKKRKQYKFGKHLDKGEKVFIKEEFAGHQINVVLLLMCAVA